ncbi:hypothetical protein ABK040_008210 [Willaertia magna]
MDRFNNKIHRNYIPSTLDGGRVASLVRDTSESIINVQDSNEDVIENEKFSDNKKITISYKRLLLIPLFAMICISIVLIFYVPLHTKLKINMVYNLQELKELYNILLSDQAKEYSFSLFCLFCSLYLLNQIFCVPGTILLNLVSGAVMGSLLGTFVCTLLTAIGSSLCHFMWLVSGRDFLLSFEWFRLKANGLYGIVQNNRRKGGVQLVWFLISLRLFPLTPSWFINIAGPLLGITVYEQFYSVFIGMAPFTFITVKAGLLLSELKSVNDIYEPQTMIFLLVLSLLSLVPLIITKLTKKREELETEVISPESITEEKDTNVLSEGVIEASRITNNLLLSGVRFLSNVIDKQKTRYLENRLKDIHKTI